MIVYGNRVIFHAQCLPVSSWYLVANLSFMNKPEIGLCMPEKKENRKQNCKYVKLTLTTICLEM